MEENRLERNKDNKNTDNKPRRVPIDGMRDILAVFGKDPRFFYYFAKDTSETGVEITRMLRAGYTFASPSASENLTVGDEAVYKSKHRNIGSIVRYPAGSTGEWLYLMKLPMELREEDEQAREAGIREIESQIDGKRDPDDNELGQYGSVKVSRD